MTGMKGRSPEGDLFRVMVGGSDGVMEGEGEGQKQPVQSVFSCCRCWFHFFHGKPDKGHTGREGSLGLICQILSKGFLKN